jgi:hypothetical protein
MNLMNDVARRIARTVGLVSPEVTAGVADAGSPAPDPLDQLKKLAELRETGAITPLEYEQHKAKLLAKL